MENYKSNSKAAARHKTSDLCFDYRCAVSLRKVNSHSKAKGGANAQQSRRKEMAGR